MTIFIMEKYVKARNSKILWAKIEKRQKFSFGYIKELMIFFRKAASISY